MEKLLEIGAVALRKAALNRDAKDFLLGNEALFLTLKKAANRYIGGEILDETILKVNSLNAEGFKCSIEFMGENVRTEVEANQATDEFISICEAIVQQKLSSTVSLDLSHIGLEISADLGRHNLERICAAASPANIEVIISAESTDQTDHVIRAYQQTSKIHDNLGITLQAYLHRTADDFSDLIARPGRIRVVKGAFETAPGLSMQRGTQLNESYLGYVDQLLSARHKCSIATHDVEIQAEARKVVDYYQPGKDDYEFESLFGIQSERIRALKDDGYMTKVYLVYGKEWYLYLCNRIAEYPLNLFLAVADIVG